MNPPLKELDKRILQDIKEHPGTSQHQVAVRLSTIYRSNTYVYNAIKRLILIGKIQDEGSGHSASLKVENGTL